MQAMLYGVYRAGVSGKMLSGNLRLFQAIALAHLPDYKLKKLPVQVDDLVLILTTESMYKEGYLATVVGGGSKEFMALPTNKELHTTTYIGFERLTSKWARENAAGCHCVITSRIVTRDSTNTELRTHSVSVYF